MTSLLLAAESVRPLSDALIQVFGRMHPILVHFPIALLLVAALLELLHAVRPGPTQRRAVDLVLHLGAVGAVFAAASGWIYTDYESPRNDLVELHRWTGVAAAVLAVIAAVLSNVARTKDSGGVVVAYRLTLLAMAGVLGFTGHLGGQMAWGRDFLFEPLHERTRAVTAPVADADRAAGAEHGAASGGAGAASAAAATDGPAAAELHGGALPSEESVAANANDPVSYERDIAPLIAASCFECHGPTGKAKGDLRLADLASADADFFSTTYDALIVPGDAARSALYAVLVLPRDDDLAMPPDGEGTPLTPAEAELVRRWIDEGTSLDAMLAAAPAGGGRGEAQAEQVASAGAPAPALAATLPASDGPTPSAPIPAELGGAGFDAVLPIFAARCFDCHGPQLAKPKGRLFVHDPAVFAAGDDPAAWLVVPGDASASHLYDLLSRPEGTEGRMPPKGPPLTSDELALVRAWIEGASDRAALVGSATPPRTADLGATSSPSATHDATDDAAPAADDADPFPHLPVLDAAALEFARGSGGRIAPLAATTRAHEAIFRFRPETTTADLEPLVAVARHLVVLDLARTSIDDAALPFVARLGELRRLHLEGTAVGDAELAALASLTSLEYLNLSQTKVGDGALDALAALPQGCRVYLWGSAVTEAGKADLAARRPDLILP
jgi:uncharacterized membrane protein